MKAVFSGMELTGFILLFIFYGAYMVWFIKENNFCQKKQDDDDAFLAPENDLEKGSKVSDASPSSTSSIEMNTRFAMSAEVNFSNLQKAVSAKQGNHEPLLSTAAPSPKA